MTDARSGLGLDHGKGQPTINSAPVGKQKLTRLFLKRNGTGPTAHHPQRTCARSTPCRYSITPSASNCSELGTARPRAAAVLRLMTSSYLSGSRDGRVPGVGTRKDPYKQEAADRTNPR